MLLSICTYCVYKKYAWALHSSLLYILSFSVLLPELCNEVGWYAAEMGRQPWAVQGLLRTKDATSPIVPAEQIVQSLILFGLVFICLLSLFIFLLCKKIRKGPDQNDLNEV